MQKITFLCLRSLSCSSSRLTSVSCLTEKYDNLKLLTQRIFVFLLSMTRCHNLMLQCIPVLSKKSSVEFGSYLAFKWDNVVRIIDGITRNFIQPHKRWIKWFSGRKLLFLIRTFSIFAMKSSGKKCFYLNGGCTTTFYYLQTHL